MGLIGVDSDCGVRAFLAILIGVSGCGARVVPSNDYLVLMYICSVVYNSRISDYSVSTVSTSFVCCDACGGISNYSMHLVLFL